MKALSITFTKISQPLVDEPSTTLPLPPHLRGLISTALTVCGTVARFLVNPHGDVDRLILREGAQITFKPHHGALIIPALGRTTGPITIAGFGQKTPLERWWKAILLQRKARPFGHGNRCDTPHTKCPQSAGT